MDELDFIERLRLLAGPGAFSLKDDCAILTPPLGHDLVISKDTMVEGVHFPKGRIGGGFSERLLRVALSDLAAKGARPVQYMLALTWPKGRDSRWIDGFVAGLRDAQDSFDITLLGGDTTSTDGPLVATATVFGVLPSGTMVTRAGAKAGQDVWYTGRLGLAKHGLSIFMGQGSDLSADDQYLAETAYLRPEPRFSLRKMIRNYASSCADISDGLLSEASHIASASEVTIDLFGPLPKDHDFGDDYELLFTAHPAHEADIITACEAAGVPITKCGRVRDGSGVSLNGKPLNSPRGYRHSF